MDVIGLWKIKTAKQFDAAAMELVEKNVEDILADTELSENDKRMLHSLFLFTEDGWVKTMIAIPENMDRSELDEMLSTGEVELYGDDMLVIEKKRWKQEDGKVKFDSGVKGETFGEKVDPWLEIKETADGIQFFTYGLVRAE